VIASAQAAVWKDGMASAHRLALVGQPQRGQVTPSASAGARTRQARRHLVHLEQEHNHLARHALAAATAAAQTLALSNPSRTASSRSSQSDGFAAVQVARSILRDSDAALATAVVAYNTCIADRGTEGPRPS
jgi:hypothetical protein